MQYTGFSFKCNWECSGLPSNVLIHLANLLSIIILFGFRCALLLYFLIAVVRINFYKNILIYLRVLANVRIRSIALIVFISFWSKSEVAIAMENAFW